MLQEVRIAGEASYSAAGETLDALKPISAHDDLYISADEGLVARYLDVFRGIFEKTGHDAHYRMMMGPEPAAPSPAAAEGVAGATSV